MRKAKNYIVWIWVFALFTATAGISFEQIYCYCLGKTSISIFKTTDACLAKKSVAKSCCKPKLPACCEKPKQHADKAHDCTHKTVKVFQLKTVFIVEKSLEKPVFPAFYLEPLVFLPVFEGSPLPFQGVLSKFSYESPPWLSGRDICIRHQTFLC
jgi:hypothetical protein